MNFRLIIILVLVGVAGVFVLQNVTTVEIRLLFWKVSMSRAVLVFSLLVLGAAIGWFVRGYVAARRKRSR